MFPQQATPLIDDWFLAEVTVVTAGSPVTYSFFELALQGDKTVSEKLGGRVGTTANPAVAAAGGPFVVGDIIKVRLARNAGGLYWEAIPAVAAADTEPGTGSASSGCGWVAGLRETDCLTLTVLSARGRCEGIDTGQTLSLLWDTDAFVSGDDAVDVPEDDFEHDGGVGPVEFWVEDGRARMTIDAVEGVMETCGPYYAVFAFGADPLCDGDADFCGDNTFRVKVECGCYAPCDVCPGEGLPLVMRVTFTGGDCDCFTPGAPITITRDPLLSTAWEYRTNACPGYPGQEIGDQPGFAVDITCIAGPLVQLRVRYFTALTVGGWGFIDLVAEADGDNSCDPVYFAFGPFAAVNPGDLPGDPDAGCPTAYPTSAVLTT
jgi:hypothetical protein